MKLVIFVYLSGIRKPFYQKFVNQLNKAKHMRTNIDLDDKTLKVVMKLTKLTTKKDAVNFALEEVLKNHARIKTLLSLRGKIKWEGNLDEMRTYDKWEDNRH